MTASEIKIKVIVKRKFYFWPVFFYFKFMIYIGRLSLGNAAEFMANRCIIVKEGM